MGLQFSIPSIIRTLQVPQPAFPPQRWEIGTSFCKRLFKSENAGLACMGSFRPLMLISAIKRDYHAFFVCKTVKMPILYIEKVDMVSLSRLIGKEGICELDSQTKAGAIAELISKASGFSRERWCDDFFTEVMRKETIQSTGFGKGVAVSHGTCRDISHLRVALGISHVGIEFQALDQKPVHLLFLVANPPETQIQYLSALSGLVRLLRNDYMREQILACQSTHQVFKLFQKAGCSLAVSA